MGLKRKIIIIVCVVLTMLMIACIWIAKHNYEMSMHFEDTNGDEDKSLSLITDEMINSYIEDYRAYKRHVSRKTDNEVRISGNYKSCDRSFIETRIGKLSGIYVCNAYKGIDKNVTYKINSTVKSGNFRIVITDEDCNILYDIPIDQEYELTFFAKKDQCYYVKFIGESAGIDVTIERTE